MIIEYNRSFIFILTLFFHTHKVSIQIRQPDCGTTIFETLKHIKKRLPTRSRFFNAKY